MAEEKIVLSDGTWDRVKELLDNVQLVKSSTEGSGEGGEQVLHWIAITDDADDDDLYTGVATIYDAETLSWEDQTGVVKVVSPSDADLTIGQRYLCSAAGSHGVVADPSSSMTDADFGTDSDGNGVYDVWVVASSAEDSGFTAKITGVGYGCGSATLNLFSWVEQLKGTCGAYSDGTRTGTLGCQPSLAINTVGDGSSTAASWTLSFSPAMIGTCDWHLILDGTTSSTLHATATASDIDSALGGHTSTTGTMSGGFTITDTDDFLVHTLVWGGGSTLQPPPNVGAYEPNNVVDFPIPSMVRMFTGGGEKAKLTLAKTATGDSPTDTIHTVYTLTSSSSTQGGTFTITLNGGTPSSDLQYDLSSSDLQTAIGSCTVTGSSLGGGYTITFSDYDDHTLTVNSALIGTLWNEFWAPLTSPTDGTCISRINGVSITKIPLGDPTHWTGGATPVVLTIDPITGCLVVMPTEACEPFVGGS